jgi:hypothetical protein
MNTKNNNSNAFPISKSAHYIHGIEDQRGRQLKMRIQRITQSAQRLRQTHKKGAQIPDQQNCINK